MARKPYKNPNYIPRIHWECGLNYHFRYWTITASAQIPGTSLPRLEVFGEYTLPKIKVEKHGMRACLEEIVRDAEISLSYKYNSLVLKHAGMNKHASAALAVITEWQDRNEKETEAET